jgi:hypothetical protein
VTGRFVFVKKRFERSAPESAKNRNGGPEKSGTAAQKNSGATIRKSSRPMASLNPTRAVYPDAFFFALD